MDTRSAEQEREGKILELHWHSRADPHWQYLEIVKKDLLEHTLASLHQAETDTVLGMQEQAHTDVQRQYAGQSIGLFLPRET